VLRNLAYGLVAVGALLLAGVVMHDPLVAGSGWGSPRFLFFAWGRGLPRRRRRDRPRVSLGQARGGWQRQRKRRRKRKERRERRDRRERRSDGKHGGRRRNARRHDFRVHLLRRGRLAIVFEIMTDPSENERRQATTGDDGRRRATTRDHGRRRVTTNDD